MPFLNTISDNILNIVFPVKCVGCGQAGSELCRSCLSDAPAAERESADWIFPLYDYRHPVIKTSLGMLKYKNKKRLAKIFAEVLYGKIIEELSELSVMQNFTEPILIPIPLSPQRRRERGFNQAELICNELIKINTLRGGAPMIFEKNILIKPKDTEHQARIRDRSVRLRNLTGTFSIKAGLENKKENKIKNKNIILIDDITTTGATLTEAKKVLKNSGARKVIAFTIAH